MAVASFLPRDYFAKGHERQCKHWGRIPVRLTAWLRADLMDDLVYL